MTCPVCHRTEIMPGCPNSACPARERTLSASDFGPSEIQLFENAALQERVRTLEAHIANMGSIGERMALAGMGMGNLQAVSHELYTYMTLYDIGDIVRVVRERRARALSELAAADAEMLEPLPLAPDCA